MKIITYSDLHLEFDSNWLPPENLEGDVMILAGDTISLKNYHPFSRLLHAWKKPVLYIMGNHEYYTQKPMPEEEKAFRSWLTAEHPQVTLLLNEAVTINGVHFFGGTMWTDFQNADYFVMGYASVQMNDFYLIRNDLGNKLSPQDTLQLHEDFKLQLLQWFEQKLTGPRVVITHHAPVINPHTQYKESRLMPAFNSLDMIPIIEQYQPDLWVYGHTHECDNQVIGKTRIISNQLGYPKSSGGFECSGFDEHGMAISLISTD